MRSQSKELLTAKRLRGAADSAIARAAAAKQQVRAAKLELKRARKASKASKKAAKQAVKKADAAAAAVTRSVRKQTTAAGKAADAAKLAAKAPIARRKAPPPRAAGRAATHLARENLGERSPAEVARSVIERLESAVPKLPPTPPAAVEPPSGESST